ncbi:MAG TPA: hypothetical protein HA367_04690 [Candidatus Methanofastidiosum sp.]|nr:hypothetical protein [Methanofastidiosum sp.]
MDEKNMMAAMIIGSLIMATMIYNFTLYPFFAGYIAYKENSKNKGVVCLLTIIISLILSIAGMVITLFVSSFLNSYLFQNESYALFWEISILMMSGAASLAVFKKNRYAGILCFPVLYIVVYFASMLIMRGVRYYAGS